MSELPTRPRRTLAPHVWRLSDVVIADGVPRPRQPETERRYDHDDRLSRDLELAANDLLRNAGDLDRWHLSPAGSESLHHVDVIDRYTRRPFVAGDRMAFRGVARWTPCSVRYRKRGTVTTAVPAFTVDTAGTVVPPHTLTEHVTHANGYGYGWVGHRRIVLQRASVKVAGAGKKSRGGQRRTVWTLDASAVRRRWQKATAEQIAVAAHLKRQLVDVGSLVIGGATVSVIVTPRQRVMVQIGNNVDRIAEAVFGIDDYVRRATLA